LREKCSTSVDFRELHPDDRTDFFDDLVFIEEVDFSFRGVYVDIDALGVDFKIYVDERVPSFGQERSKCLVHSLFQGGGFDGTMIDEEQEHNLFYVVIRVGGPARSFESILCVADTELNEFVGNGTAMDLTNAIYCSGIRRRRYPQGRLPMLLAREGNPCAMYSISAYDIEDFCIFFARRLESPLAGWDVVK
jgi:hypothetical protein